MIQHVAQMGALPETMIALTVKFEDIPRVWSERVELEHVFDDFWHMTVHYGFIEVPDLPSALGAAKHLGCPLDLTNACYFASRDQVVRGAASGRFRHWWVPLFAFMYRNAVRAVDLFDLPPDNFVEVARQLDI
jgi:KUP system potassium uptake protein